MAILYAESTGFRNAAIGKLETPIKMIIEHESDLMTKKGGIRDWLFNVEKSNKFGETIVNNNEFDTFQAVLEGAGAENDTLSETSRKFIEHIQFMKEFTITAQMMEDANYGVAADAKSRAENFVRAYYKTMHKICEFALMNGTLSKITFAKAGIDLTTGDNLPLFSGAHVWGGGVKKSSTQSNYFYGAASTSSGTVSTSVIEEALGKLASHVRNMKDENGDVLGYTADTIILPGNRPALETAMKKVCGSEGALGNGYNDINIQYGNWNIIVLPDWQLASGAADEYMVMSSEANKNLAGNMFFNRVPLKISNWEDNHTGNYIWNGRCRFGVGFGSYKHIVRVVDGSSQVGTSTAL